MRQHLCAQVGVPLAPPTPALVLLGGPGGLSLAGRVFEGGGVKTLSPECCDFTFFLKQFLLEGSITVLI